MKATKDQIDFARKLLEEIRKLIEEMEAENKATEADIMVIPWSFSEGTNYTIKSKKLGDIIDIFNGNHGAKDVAEKVRRALEIYEYKNKAKEAIPMEFTSEQIQYLYAVVRERERESDGGRPFPNDDLFVTKNEGEIYAVRSLKYGEIWKGGAAEFGEKAEAIAHTAKCAALAYAKEITHGMGVWAGGSGKS